MAFCCLACFPFLYLSDNLASMPNWSTAILSKTINWINLKIIYEFELKELTCHLPSTQFPIELVLLMKQLWWKKSLQRSAYSFWRTHVITLEKFIIGFTWGAACSEVSLTQNQTVDSMKWWYSNLRATSMRWTTLLFWSILPNQSSDQHVLLFMYTKEERWRNCLLIYKCIAT